MEHICILEGTYEDGHLGYETRETWQTEVWGEFVIGSAGGIDITATLDYKEVETDKEDAFHSYYS